jgi:hypothetical protein
MEGSRPPRLNPISKSSGSEKSDYRELLVRVLISPGRVCFRANRTLEPTSPKDRL